MKKKDTRIGRASGGPHAKDSLPIPRLEKVPRLRRSGRKRKLKVCYR